MEAAPHPFLQRRKAVALVAAQECLELPQRAETDGRVGEGGPLREEPAVGQDGQPAAHLTSGLFSLPAEEREAVVLQDVAEAALAVPPGGGQRIVEDDLQKIKKITVLASKNSSETSIFVDICYSPQSSPC